MPLSANVCKQTYDLESPALLLLGKQLKTLKEARATAELSIDNANARALGSERIVFSGRW